MSTDIVTLIIGFVEGLGVAIVVILALLIGFCVLLTLPKLRPSTRKSLVIRSLDERTGGPTRYLPPDAPRGTVDQLAAGTRQAARP